MKSFKQIYKERVLIEMSPPWYDPDGLTKIDPITRISLGHLRSAWKLLKKFDDTVSIYKRRDGFGFIMGIKGKTEFKIYSNVNCTSPRSGTPNIKNSVQVEMVYANEGFEKTGYTKLMYKEIAKSCILISDSEQYGYSKKLWKTLSKMDDINVYVYDCLDKSTIKYNGRNISENEIWGKTDIPMRRVLIATDKELI